MSNNELNINLFSHPTTVVIIDDNQDFLNSLLPVMPHQQNIYKLFNNPNLGEEYFAKYKEQEDNFFKAELNKEKAYEVSLETRAIFNNLYNKNRFDQVSTVIVDYELNGKNGLELLSKIQDKAMYKILLTGVADEKIAIEAFNKGLINRYVKKQDHYFMIEELRESIINAQSKFFQRKLDSLESTIKDSVLPPILHDKCFGELLSKIIKELNIIEYYICQDTGSIVFMDANKNIGILCIYNEETMQDISALLKEDEEYAIFRSSNGEKQIICYVEDLITDFSKGLILKAKKLESDETYYYAVINNIKVNNMDKITSFNEFKKETIFF